MKRDTQMFCFHIFSRQSRVNILVWGSGCYTVLLYKLNNALWSGPAALPFNRHWQLTREVECLCWKNARAAFAKLRKLVLKWAQFIFKRNCQFAAKQASRIGGSFMRWFVSWQHRNYINDRTDKRNEPRDLKFTHAEQLAVKVMSWFRKKKYPPPVYCLILYLIDVWLCYGNISWEKTSDFDASTVRQLVDYFLNEQIQWQKKTTSATCAHTCNPWALRLRRAVSAFKLKSFHSCILERGNWWKSSMFFFFPPRTWSRYVMTSLTRKDGSCVATLIPHPY